MTGLFPKTTWLLPTAIWGWCTELGGVFRNGRQIAKVLSAQGIKSLSLDQGLFFVCVCVCLAMHYKIHLGARAVSY